MNNKSDRNFSTQTNNTQQPQTTANIPDSPQGWDNLKWLGPSAYLSTSEDAENCHNLHIINRRKFGEGSKYLVPTQPE